MSNLTYECLINEGQYSQLNVGTALASSVTLTDISPGGNTAGQAFSFPANYLQAGHQIRVRANGIVSNTGTPTLLIGVYLGGVAGTALATTTALTTLTGLSNNIWTFDAIMRVDAVGTSGSIRTIGSVAGPFTGFTLIPATSSSGNNITVNTSVASALTLGAQWGASSASNSIQVMQFTVERMNEGSS